MATLKQIALAKKVSENIGKGRPITELMKEAGYSDQTSRTQQKTIQKGLGFVELLDLAGATNKRLAVVLNDGLNALNDKRRKDYMTRKHYAELIMKSRGLIKDNSNNELGSLSNFIENMKDFNLDILISMKQRIAPSESTNVTPTT